MKKYLFIIVLLFIYHNANAQYYRNFYDKNLLFSDNDNLYIGIKAKIDYGIISKSEKITSNISNYLIYNLSSKAKKFIFPKNSDRNIQYIFFEKEYDSVTKKIKFNINENQTDEMKSIVINNDNIGKREIIDSILLVITYGDKTSKFGNDNYEIWKAKKDGSNLKKLCNFFYHDSYHIDIKNKKILIIIQNDLETKIEEYNWDN